MKIVPEQAFKGLLRRLRLKIPAEQRPLVVRITLQIKDTEPMLTQYMQQLRFAASGRAVYSYECQMLKRITGTLRSRTIGVRSIKRSIYQSPVRAVSAFDQKASVADQIHDDEKRGGTHASAPAVQDEFALRLVIEPLAGLRHILPYDLFDMGQYTGNIR